MNIDDLRLLVRVAELGSLTKAASAIGQPQSAVSRTIIAFEKRWGGQLFLRTGRGMTLSELGIRVLPKVRALLEAAIDIDMEVEDAAGVPMGSVVLGLVPAMVPLVVEPLFERLRTRYPHVKLSIVEGYSGQIEEWLATGRVEVAALFHYGEPLSTSHEILMEADSYLIGVKGDRITDAPTVAFSKLHGLPLILPPEPNGFRVRLRKLCRSHSVEPNVVMEAASAGTQFAALAAGGCYVIGPIYAAIDAVRSGKLQAALIVEPRIPRSVALSMTAHRPATLASRTVATLVRETIADWKRMGFPQLPPYAGADMRSGAV